MTLEVCVDNVSSALSACRGGAKRLELCCALALGGLTPSLGLFTTLKKLVPQDCAIFVMIRPKPGETYIYDSHEVELMVEDIKIFKQHGADGFVFGCLTNVKDVDEHKCLKLLKAASDLPCTFHRAFDVVRNPEDALMTLIKLGFSRILTSGQEENAFLGRQLIEKLVLKVKESGSSLIIVPGGGVSPENLKEILETTKVKEYHSSARAKGFSKDEPLIYATDESTVKHLVEIGKRFNL